MVRQKESLAWAVCVLALSALASAAEPESSTAGDTILEAHRLVAGARPDWSAAGDWIAYDAAGDDGLYDVYLISAELGAVPRCITCKAFELRKTHNFNASWHPSGDYLILQVQQNAKRLGLDGADLITPERGLHSDLWLLRADGRDFYQLTRAADNGSAVLDPHFSYEGELLVWSERRTTHGSRWGEWVLRQGSIRIRRGLPKLRQVKEHRVGDCGCLVVANEFFPDDESVLLSGNLEPGQSDTGLDLYRYDPETEELERLTHTRSQIDDNGHVTPRGDRIVWASNSELFPRARPERLPPTLLRDLWVMELDGSKKQRLTYFNDSGHPESVGEAYVGDFSWRPEGDRLAVHVLTNDDPVEESIYLLVLDPSFRRGP